MDPFPPTALDELIGAETGPFVSIQLPTHRVGPGATPQDTTTYRKLVGEARNQLEASQWRTPDANALLGQAADLERDNKFWSHQDAGLAVFVSPGLFRTQRLDRAPSPLAHVSQRGFHLKELLPLTDPRRFLTLSISRNQLRLVEADRTGARVVELTDVPASLAEALWFEDPEQQLQHHQASGPSAVFHGHGAEYDDKDRVRRFAQRIRGDLVNVLREHDAPLVLAGVAYEVAIFRQELRYESIVEGTLEGNFDDARPDELAAAAAVLMEPRWEAPLRRDLERFGAMEAAERTLQTVPEVLEAARQGRVETLIVATGQPLWAAPERPDDIHERPEPLDEDLANQAALSVRANGGTVHVAEAIDVPGGGVIAAILRF